MSYGTSGDSRLTKNEKREAARDKARILREEQKKKDRRTKILLQGGIVLASVAIVAVIALVLVNSARPAGPGPLNMASDGIQIGQGGIALETPALKAGQDPIPNERDESSDTIAIQMWVDYLCPICGTFEATNGDYLDSLLENGKTTLEIHPIAILDNASQGTRYSSRAVNAAACVANYSPNNFLDFNNLMFVDQPAENTQGRSNEEIIAIALQAKVENSDKITSCINDEQFKAWAKDSKTRALNGPIPNSNIDKVLGTPTVLVNGQKYEGPVNDPEAFKAFVVKAAGDAFIESSTPTPTPTPTPTVAP